MFQTLRETRDNSARAGFDIRFAYEYSVRLSRNSRMFDEWSVAFVYGARVTVLHVGLQSGRLKWAGSSDVS